MKKFLFTLLLLPLSIFAVGTISGSITDADGDDLNGVAMVLLEDLFQEDTDTSASGAYSFTNVRAGTFTVRATLNGYETQIKSVTVVDNQTSDLDFTMATSSAVLQAQVYDENLNILDGATIRFIKDNSLYATATTPVTGFVDVNGLPDVAYVIDAQKDDIHIIGSLIQNTGTALIIANSGADTASITANITAVGATSDPIVNLIVNGSVIRSQQVSAGSTTFSSIGAGTYTISASSPGFQDNSSTATLISNLNQTINLTLSSQPSTLVGTIFHDTSGAYLDNVLVEVFQDNTLVASDLTDSNGAYTIDTLASGTYEVHVSHEDYKLQSTTVELSVGQTLSRDFTLEINPTTLTGKVTASSSGSNVTGAEVKVFSNSTLLFTGFTDPSGNYSITGVDPDDYVITISASGFQAKQSNVTVTTGTNENNFVLLDNPAILTGTVRALVGNTPLPNSIVNVYQNSLLVGSIKTDILGRYRFAGLPSGDISIYVQNRIYQNNSEDVTLTAGATTIQNFLLGASPNIISGTVVNGVTNQVVPSALVSLYLNNIPVYTIVSNPNGTYRFNGIAPGNYHVAATAQNFVPSSLNAVTVSGTNQTVTQNLSVYAQNSPPQNLIGNTIDNEFLFQSDRIHQLSWTASTSAKVSGYRVYRNNQLLATLASSARSYEDHNRSESEKDTYTVKTLNTDGSESTGVSVSLQ